MVRKWLEPVSSYPLLKAKQKYRMAVTAIRKQKAKDRNGRRRSCMEVTFSHRNPEQEGRPHVECLWLPVHEAGLARSFLDACKLRPDAQGRFAPEESVGAELMARFAQQSGQWRIVSFEPLNEEHNHESNSQSTV
jgi:hypothetical protein